MRESADYYEVLRIDPAASAERVRRAFRKRVLEVHPDKSRRPPDARLLPLVLEAFSVLGNPAERERYDRQRRTVARRRRLRGRSGSIPHVTESERPADRARAVLYLLMLGKGRDALARIARMDGRPISYLAHHLERNEFVDAAFLLGEYLEERGKLAKALEWYQALIGSERKRTRRRPCYAEALERAKRILIQGVDRRANARTLLDSLRRAESLGLERRERIEVTKRRAQCYLELGMREEAARQLRLALRLDSRLRGVRRLRALLADLL